MLDSDAHEQSPGSGIIRFRPPRIALALLCLAGLLHWGVPVSRITVFANAAFGAALAVAGFALMILAWWLFRQAGTAVCPTEKSSRMVTRGPYAWTRNPMYLGMTAMLLGVSFFLLGHCHLSSPRQPLGSSSIPFSVPTKSRSWGGNLENSTCVTNGRFAAGFEGWLPHIQRWD